MSEVHVVELEVSALGSWGVRRLGFALVLILGILLAYPETGYSAPLCQPNVGPELSGSTDAIDICDPEPTEPPPTPGSFIVPTSDSDGAYTVAWGYSSGASRYQLLESPNNSSWTTIQNSAARSKGVSGKSNGRWYYKVRACNSLNLCSGYAATKSVLVSIVAMPSPIVGPGTDDDGDFTLSWGAVSSATHYDIQRRVGGGAWFSQIVTSASLDETGMDDGTWNYRVRACTASSCSSWTSLHTIVVAITGPPPAPPPVPGSAGDPGASRESDETGTTSGSFRVDESGSATYSVPIATAAGTAGVAPELSLNYSSGGGNGVAGMGWSVGGMSAITRCKQTFDQDRNPLPITWSGADRYCLDGQRLLLENSSATYGAAGTTYRTEVDNGAIVTIKGSVNGEPDYFEVRRKDGSTSYLGESPDDPGNNSAKSGGAPGQTFIWAIRHFKDNIGNPIWFDYYNDASGQRIKTVYWAFGHGRGPNSGHGARVEFAYTNRDDDRVGYVAGVSLNTTKRLGTIKSYNVIGSASLIRQYNLAYNEGISATDDVSRLTSIEECAGGACFPETTFNWRVPTATAYLSQVSTRTLAESSDLSDLTLADINGDGLMDMVWLEGAVANAKMNYAISNGTSLAQKPFSNGSYEYTLPNGGEKMTPIDYNLDGRYDIAYWDDESGFWRIVVSQPQSDGSWRLSSATQLTPIDSEQVTFADIDSNGTTDAVWDTNTSSLRANLKRSLLTPNPSRSTSSSTYYHFGTPADVEGPSIATTGALHTVVPDLNGDGRIGIIVGRSKPKCGRRRCQTARRSYALSIVDPTSSTPTYAQYANLNEIGTILSSEYVITNDIVATDINADGLSDLFLPVSNAANKYHLAVNKGDGTFDVRQHSMPTVISGEVQKPQFIDWNGDNYPDLVWKDTTGSGTVKARFWDASTNALSTVTRTLSYLVSTSDKESVYFPDMNGDGVPDMVKIDTSNGKGTVTVYTRKAGSSIVNRASNRIEKITNGIGAETSVTYEPLSYSNHYERMVVDSAPQAPGGGPRHCIWKYEVEPICVNPPVTAASAAEFYATINGEWVVPDGATSLQKTSPVIEVAGPMYVVTDVVGSAPAATLSSPHTVDATATSAVEYHYYEAKVQAAGRGFLGFQQLKTVDTVSNVKTTTQYRQDWPYTGLPVGTVFASSNNNVIGGGSTSWDVLEWTASMPATAAVSGTAALGPLHVEQTQNTNNVYDLVGNGTSAGTLLSTTTTATSYDSEANALVVTAMITNQLTQQDEQIATTTNVYDTTTFDRWQGRLINTTVVTDRPAAAGTVTRHSAFSYYTSGAYAGMLRTEVIEPGHPKFELTTTHYHDAHGNRRKSSNSDRTTTRCSAPAATSVFDGSGRYVDLTYDCLGRLSTAVLARNGFGLPTKFDTVLDATHTSSRLTTNIYYGVMGREYFRTAEDGSFKTTYLSKSTANCPTGTSYKATEYTAGGGTSEACFDGVARETRKLTLGFDGEWDAQDTNYDNKGRVLHKSEPYELSSGAAYWTSIEYDLLDRVTKTTLPDASWSQAAYSSFDTTTAISYQNQTRTEKRNALGNIVQAIDNLSGDVDFTYDNLGNLTTTADSAGNVTTTIHNILGQKVSMRVPHSNPAKGLWTYDFNHFGEMIKQTNANGHMSIMTYDGLGRMKTRIDKFASGATDTSSTWTYDTSPNGLSKLDSVSDGQSGIAKAVLYDSLGRVDEVVTNFDAGAYFERTTYDQYGRLHQVFDAAGNGTFTDHGTQNQYGYYGHLVAVADAVEVNGAPRTIYRQIIGMNARGQVTNESLGVDAAGNAAVSSEFFYYENTGRMKDIKAKDITGAFVQDLYYEWNDAGSLNRRQDTYHGVGGPNTLTEVFGYDGLNRLTSHGELGQVALSVTYDALGNIKTKSGVAGTYNYGSNAGPHALTRLNGQIYNYDANGNNISGGGRSIVYSTFDKPTNITKGGNSVSFAYGVDRARYRRVDQDANGTTTTRYIGNVEIIERPNGAQERKRYIAGVAIETGFYTGGNETSRKTIYTLKDHLGSLDVILDDAGQIEQKLSFGPWGQRREATNWKEVNTSSLLIDLGPSFDNSRTTRGFTGHEMIDSVGIVHMNGRIYDPFLGRFLQSDNYVQDPTNTQSHNRYSYVWNNPLNATDPSGEFVFTLFAIALVAANAVEGYFAIMAVFALAGTLDAMIAGADLSDAFLTGIISGLSAGAFSYAGSTWFYKLQSSFSAGLYAAKIAVHGAIGGITSVLQGGKFGHGFASAGFSAAASGFNNSQYIHKNSNGFSWRRVAIGAAIGGSASQLSGGKFANGAMTGSFSQALNGEMSEVKQAEVANLRLRVSALVKGIAELSLDSESLSLALQTKTKVQIKVTDDGTITVTGKGGQRAIFDGSSMLEGVGLKGRIGTIDIRAKQNGTVSVSAKFNTPINFLGLVKIRIAFVGEVKFNDFIMQNSGLVGGAARDLNPATRREKINNQICMDVTGKACSY